MRAVGAGARFNVTDDFGGNSVIGLGLIEGLPVLNASRSGEDLLSRSRGTANFLKATLNAAREQQISGPWNAYLAVSGQESDEVLLSSEEFGVGGAQFGRAYDPSEITGSRGVAGSLELRYNGSVGAKGIVVGYQFYGFMDYGAVWNNPFDGGSNRDTLSSTGAGVRVGWRGHYFGDTELAFPLTRGVATNGGSKGGPRLFFSLTATF